MSFTGQHDTLRRVVTSVAILGSALVLFDGGRGLTGRAGGGAVGCGGAYDVDTAGQGQDSFSPVHSRALVHLSPVLQLDQKSLSYKGSKPGGSKVGIRPNPTPRTPTTPGAGSINYGVPRSGPSIEAALDDVGARRFGDLIRQVGLDGVLGTPNRRFTVFAPSDEAIVRLEGEFPDLFIAKNAVLLQDFVAAHIVAEDIPSSRLQPFQYEPLLSGAQIEVSEVDGEVVLGLPGQGVASIDKNSEILASNGVVFRVDKAVIPRFTVWSHLRNSGFTYLVMAIEAANQIERFSDVDESWTVLAPSDDAFRLAGWDQNRIHDPGFRAQVEAIIEAHIINDVFDTAKLLNDVRQTEDGVDIKVFDDGTQILIERAAGDAMVELVNSNVQTDGGFVHGLDGLLVSPE